MFDIIIVGTFVLIFLQLVLASELGVLSKFILSVIGLALSGEYIRRKLKFDGEYGLMLLRTRSVNRLIDTLSLNKGFITLFSDVGLTLSYGLFSFLLIKNKKTLFFGLVLLTLFLFVVSPLIVSYLSMLLPEFSAKTVEGVSSFSWVILLFYYLGGFVLTTIIGLLSQAIIIVYSVIQMITSPQAEIAAPGATLLLPGINLPLVEGILAVISVLVVHEMAHGIVSRSERIKIHSTGIVVFGIIPIGAFVEPDEHMLIASPKEKQRKVYVAGSTANLFLSLIITLLILSFQFFSYSLPLTILNILLLSSTLNFVVGVVNLLPLPFFDGGELLRVSMSKDLSRLAAAVVGAAFLLNLLPWVFL